MGRVLAVSVLSSSLFLVATGVRAQSPVPLPSTPIQFSMSEPSLSPQQQQELDAWLDAMRKWQKFEHKWHNEPAHDPFGRIVERKPQPDAPSWLDAFCTAGGPLLLVAQTPEGQACRLQAGLAVDLQAEEVRAETAAARAAHERVVKDTFFSRVHLDGLWTTTSTDARLYGLVGSHISLVDVGRVQFFGPPGVIVLSVPDGSGSREIRMGYTWGMSVRLADVRVFAPTKNLTLFLDLTKVWIVGSTTYDRLQADSLDLVGFSLAPRRKR